MSAKKNPMRDGQGSARWGRNADLAAREFDVEESTARDYTDPKIPEIPCVLITRTDY